MPIADRRKDNGQAASAYSERALYDVVADVIRYVSPGRPEAVTQRAFDRSRAAAGHPQAPSARAICMRLGSKGASMSWARLRRHALADDLHKDRSYSKHRGQDIGPEMDVRHLVFALKWAAREAEQASLTPDDYEDTRRELLRRDRRMGRYRDHDSLLPGLLPSKGQIERIARDHDVQQRRELAKAQASEQAAGDAADSAEDQVSEQGVEDNEPAEPSPPKAAPWDLALALAGLEPRTTLAPRPNTRPAPDPKSLRLDIEVAIHHFIESNDSMPSEKSLQDFARLVGTAVATRSKPWADHLDDARAYRAQLGLDSPSENPKPLGHAVRREVKVPEGGIPGAPPSRKGRRRYSEEDCLNAVERFDREAPPSEPRTRPRYARFSVEHGTVPPNNFRHYGGFTALMKKARQRRRQHQP